jgi:sarcosine oxidase subunit gamma
VFVDPEHRRRDGSEARSDMNGTHVRTPTTLHLKRDASAPLVARASELASIAKYTGGSVHVGASFLAQVNLRIDRSLVDLERLPFSVPIEPNTAIEIEERSVLWLGPDEWMIIGPEHTEEDLVDELERALSDRHRSVVDVSADRIGFDLSGGRRAELLSRGCSLDLHPRMWRQGMCAQTMLGKASVILHERAATTRVLVRTSFADYMLDWLLAAGRRFRETTVAGQT